MLPPLDLNALRNPRSVGRLLASWAVRAGKTEALNQAIAARGGEQAQLPAAVLKTQLALAAKQPLPAIEALGSIAARMKNDTSRTTSELAVQAALPALEGSDPKLAKAALDVLDSCAKGLESTGQSEPVASLLLLLARRQFSAGDLSGGRKRLEAYLEATEKTTVRYAGDYSLYLRKQNLERVAGEYARAGLWADALLTLGRFLDAPVYSGGDPPVDGTLARVLRQLEKNPASERYQTLRAWTLPEKDRQSIRMLTSALESETTPSAFLRRAPGSASTSNEKPAAAARNHTTVSTARALIEAARECGKLDELASQAAAAAALKEDRKVENAEMLHLLVELARGQGARVLKEIDDRTSALAKEHEQGASPNVEPHLAAKRRGVMRNDQMSFPETDFQLARAALADSDTAVRSAGVRLADALENARREGRQPARAGAGAERACRGHRPN